MTPQGPPELKQVAVAVDEMQRTISQQRDDAIRAREAIEQSAILAVQVRSELASDLGDYPEGWTMAAGLRPAEGVVAGDCYDVALLSPTTIGVVVLDIAGHGAQSAIAALKCKELLKAALRSDLEPGAALTWLSEQEHGLGDLFLTAFLAVIDTDSRQGYVRQRRPPPRAAGGGARSPAPRADWSDPRAVRDEVGDRFDGRAAGRKADHLHRRPRRGPRRRPVLLRR